ncbi:hypothetical protein [Metabacillus fastidiosus]|uniref:Transmembrane protein n=1 Tax=Metabacillus fastidiosus TaxID=1458 RepID=A0ABU6NVA2_9BACI|nr:hypothetical protein [Metabacillus fastidiosus]
MNFGSMSIQDILWRLCWAFFVGGSAHFLRYTHQCQQVKITEAVRASASGGFAGVLAVSIFNSDGNPFEIFAISATTGISGIAWVLAKSDISPEREKELLNKNKSDFTSLKELRSRDINDVRKNRELIQELERMKEELEKMK